MALTFWVVLISMLQVFDDAVLADDLLDLPLGVDVEGVFVEQGDLILALAFGIPFLVLLHCECFSPTGGVVEGGDELRLLLPELFLGCGVAQDV
jgi:hypothetical protein